MNDPKLLRLNILDYFALLQEGYPPTPPGLAMAIGLRGFDALLRIVKEEDLEPGTYPAESMDALMIARSMIEDFYITHGLRDAIPTQFTKFLLSAFFNRSEKTIQEMVGGTDNTLEITIAGVSTTLPHLENNKFFHITQESVLDGPQQLEHKEGYPMDGIIIDTYDHHQRAEQEVDEWSLI